MSELDANDLRGLAKDLNASAVDLIEQVLQKHTAAILDVVRDQTRELETERERVRALREALENMVSAAAGGNGCESFPTAPFDAALDALATTEDKP